MRAYVLAGSPRTGGNWLCQLLRGAGYGHPAEHLQILRADKHGRNRYRSSFAPFWRPHAPYFGTKLHWGEFQVDGRPLQEMLPIPVDQTRFILQTREPRAQAYSWLRARQTADWYSAPHDTPEINFPESWLDEFTLFAQECTSSWRSYLAGEGLAYMHLRYEDLAADPHGSLERVKSYIDS